MVSSLDTRVYIVYRKPSRAPDLTKKKERKGEKESKGRKGERKERKNQILLEESKK